MEHARARVPVLIINAHDTENTLGKEQLETRLHTSIEIMHSGTIHGAARTLSLAL